MILKLLPALPHSWLNVVPVLLLWAECFQLGGTSCKLELAALIYRNTWINDVVQENKSLSTFKIFIVNTGSHGQSKIKCKSPFSP